MDFNESLTVLFRSNNPSFFQEPGVSEETLSCVVSSVVVMYLLVGTLIPFIIDFLWRLQQLRNPDHNLDNRDERCVTMTGSNHGTDNSQDTKVVKRNTNSRRDHNGIVQNTEETI